MAGISWLTSVLRGLAHFENVSLHSTKRTVRYLCCNEGSKGGTGLFFVQLDLYGVFVKKSLPFIVVSAGLMFSVLTGSSSLGQRHLEFTERQNLINKYEYQRA